ncbi:MAG: GWxTD domain-containing protein [Ignavibacteriaceae bacterium]
MKKIVILILCALPVVLLSQTNSLYEQGIKALAAGDISAAEDFFEDSAEDENYAPAYYELAKIYLSEDSWSSLDNARGYLKDAIELDSLNLEYRLLLGNVYERIEKTNWFVQLIRLNLNPREKAIETYREILEIDSLYTPAQLSLAAMYETDYYSNVNTMSFIQYEHPDYVWNPGTAVDERADAKMYNEYLNTQVIDGQYPAVYYNEKAKDYFEKSTGYYLSAIKSTLENEEPYYKLSLLLCSNSLQDSAVKIAEAGLVHFPNSSKLALAAGYANYKLKNYSETKRYFESAFNLMSPGELYEYKVQSFFSLLTPEEKSATEEMDDKELGSYIKLYWKQRDPLTVTDYNERELEHYARFFYVNQYFSIPDKNIRGWQTDRGDIWLRYGEPKKLMNIKKDTELNGLDESTLSGELTIFPEAYVMSYSDGRTFSFIDEFNSKEFVHTEKSLSGRLGMQFFSDSKNLSENLRRTEPEEYLLKVKASILNIPSSIVQVRNNRDRKSTMLYLSYAMPLKEDSSGYIPVRHIHDISLMDYTFHTLAQQRDTVNYTGITKLNWFDGQKYIFSSSGITASPGTGFLSFEILRPEDNGMYINHGRYEVKDFSRTSLNMSDVIAAYDVLTSETQTASISRGELHILPNPIKTFNKDRPPFIYYEIYNLQKNDKKLTDFEQEIIILEKPDEGFITSAWNSILSIAGIDTENKISLKSDYNTLESDPQIYVQLDLRDYDPADYIITVKIKDKLSGEEISSSVEITWQ